MFREHLGLDRTIGSTNLGVVLEIYHHQGNQWERCAAILHGQEFLHRYELMTKVIGQIIEARGACDHDSCFDKLGYV